MSLRCSLLGHSYGDAEIEREREEQGSEVVVTVREFEECERCGDRKIVTENKEVTALQSSAPDLESAESGSATDAATGSTGRTETTARANASADSDATTPETTTSPDATGGRTASGQSDVQLDADAEVAGGDDAEIIGGSSEGEESSEPAGASGSSEAPEPDSSPDSTGVDGSDASSTAGETDLNQSPSAADDDGVILDDDGDSSAGDDDRTPGEWPEAETTHPTEVDHGPGNWPAVGSEDGDDEGYDAEPAAAGSADVDFGGSLTPESADVDDETDDVEFVNAEGDALRSRDDGASSPELSSGISAEADAPSLSGPAADPDVDAEFVCPECDYREGVAGSSLRAGDICPECSRGYLAQE